MTSANTLLNTPANRRYPLVNDPRPAPLPSEEMKSVTVKLTAPMRAALRTYSYRTGERIESWDSDGARGIDSRCRGSYRGSYRALESRGLVVILTSIHGTKIARLTAAGDAIASQIAEEDQQARERGDMMPMDLAGTRAYVIPRFCGTRVDFSDAYAMPDDEDQPTTCPQCGSRTTWHEIPGAGRPYERHVCNNRECEFPFIVEHE